MITLALSFAPKGGEAREAFLGDANNKKSWLTVGKLFELPKKCHWIEKKYKTEEWSKTKFSFFWGFQRVKLRRLSFSWKQQAGRIAGSANPFIGTFKFLRI